MIRIQAEDFDVGGEIAALTRGKSGIGGVASFVGLVRDVSDGARFTSMTLEHYPGMTERKLADIEAESRRRWALDEVLVIHRVGRLDAGERIVLVAVAAAHRQAAFEACQFIIDWLKTEAPFWKHEETDAGPRWVEARASDRRAASRWQES